MLAKLPTRTVSRATPPSSRRWAERKARFSSVSPTLTTSTSSGQTGSPAAGPSVKSQMRSPFDDDSSRAIISAGAKSCAGWAGAQLDSSASARAASACGPATTLGRGPLSTTVTRSAPSCETAWASARTARCATGSPPTLARIERLPSSTATRCFFGTSLPQRTSERKRAAVTTAATSSASEASREKRSKRGPAWARWLGVRQRKRAETRRGFCRRRRK